jgi:Putative transposase
LSHHPHVHALVSAGGLTPDLRWRPTRAGFLLPLKPLRLLFAGKLLAALRSRLDAGELRLPPEQPPTHWSRLLHSLYRKHWNIQINPPYDSGRSVTLYLARYAKGGPLPRQRALFMNPTSVSFEYTDHRDSRSKRLTLEPNTFIARVLWHAPPKGVHTVRHAGLYAAAAKRHHRFALIALTLPAPSDLPAPTSLPRSNAPRSTSAPLCPVCSTPLSRTFSRPSPMTAQAINGIPLLKSAHPCQQPSHHLLTPRPNPSFKLTRHGRPPGPRAAQLHDASRGPGALPRRAA